MALRSKVRIKARAAKKPKSKGGGYTACQIKKMAQRTEQQNLVLSHFVEGARALPVPDERKLSMLITSPAPFFVYLCIARRGITLVKLEK